MAPGGRTRALKARQQIADWELRSPRTLTCRAQPVEIQARRDRREATAGRCPSLAGSEHGRRDPPDWGERGRLRDELLNGEIFYTLREAQIIIESWRRHYNAIRPHASLGYKPPAP